ncbi:hypothetical protein Tco_0766751 [Tanacetum coccineum]
MALDGDEYERGDAREQDENNIVDDFDEDGVVNEEGGKNEVQEENDDIIVKDGYEILLQEEFEIRAVKQYSNTCRGVAKQAFHRKCLPLVAPKCSKTLVAKCGPIQRLSNISIGCDSMEMLNVASIGRDRM